MAEVVRITDVSPRDGLQNEPGIIPSFEKAMLVKQLCGTGVDEVEVTSFVSPKWVPQLGDGKAVLREACDSKGDTVIFSALVPNLQGLTAALDAMAAAQSEVRSRRPARSLDKVAVFTAASESFSQKNTNASIRESVRRFVPVVELAHKNSLAVRGYISCVIACPFEGPVSPSAVANVASMLLDVGVDELDLGDTIGAGTPDSTRTMLDAVIGRLGPGWLQGHKSTLHLHDTFSRAADCVKAALDFGIRSFDGSVAGLGGCPYASTPGKRAPGNISTELLVRTIELAGFKTNVDQGRLAIAADYARAIVATARAGAVP
jgi:hydroxymethylglutaryl-CoA lyase